MKRFLPGLLLIISSFANGQPGVADSPGPASPLGEAHPTAAQFPRSVVKINPLSLLAGQLSAFYEHALTDRKTLVVGYGMGSNSGNFGTKLPEGGGIYQRITIEGRYYWMGRSLNGFYAGPYLRLSRFTESEIVLDAQGKAIRDNMGNRLTDIRRALIWIPGVMIGGQALLKRFAIDAFIGFQFQIVSGQLYRTNQFVEAMSSNFVPRFGISVGYAF